MTILLEAEGLTKTYGPLVALSNGALTLRNGEVRSLVGANGAGKSTLIKILTGAIVPDKGKVVIEGEPVPLGNPLRMLQMGIACIYQHSNLVPHLSVLDNIFLGRQPTKRFGLLDRKQQRRDAETLLEHFYLNLDLDEVVQDLPPVKQKEVEIAKALSLNTKILLMDEPTAWLSHSEVDKLFQAIQNLKENGVGIVYISHVLDELYTVCDTVTILRDGKVVTDCGIHDISRQELLRKFIGETLAKDATDHSGHTIIPKGTGEVKLACKNLTKKGVFEDISFEVYKGEIFCITGLIGAKRTELIHTIFGSDSFDQGDLLVDGQSFRPESPIDAIKHKIGFVPEDRHRDGLMMQMSVENNLIMPSLDQVKHLGFLRRNKIVELVMKLIKGLSIVPADPKKEVSKLSGGNQQKVLIGKWLGTAPNILILDEPTVGVDVGAKSEIYGIIRKFRDSGTAILVVSSDMEEVMTISDRIMVMCSGQVQGIYHADQVTQRQIVAFVGED